MTDPGIGHTVEAVRTAVNGARQLKDDAAWLHGAAYGLVGRNPDRPTRAVPIDPTNPDNVPGELWDLGTPVDVARRHYTTAVVCVADAARLAGDAIILSLGRPAEAAALEARGHDFNLTVDRAVRRLRLIQSAGITLMAGATRQAAWSSANQLLTAHTTLRLVMRDSGGVTEPTADRRCRNCGAPHLEPDRTGSECPACRKWRARHNGHPRPHRRHADALAARARRRERGEGHGDESGGVQAGTFRAVDGATIWIPAQRRTS